MKCLRTGTRKRLRRQHLNCVKVGWRDQKKLPSFYWNPNLYAAQKRSANDSKVPPHTSLRGDRLERDSRPHAAWNETVTLPTGLPLFMVLTAESPRGSCVRKSTTASAARWSVSNTWIVTSCSSGSCCRSTHQLTLTEHNQVTSFNKNRYRVQPRTKNKSQHSSCWRKQKFLS